MFCLVPDPRPRYLTAVNRFGSRGPGRFWEKAVQELDKSLCAFRETLLLCLST